MSNPMHDAEANDDAVAEETADRFEDRHVRAEAPAGADAADDAASGGGEPV